MKFSIVTVAYNAESTIGRTIRSVSAQDHGEIEHVVIDGASSDRTALIAREMLGPSGILVSEPDSGLYDAMNKGVKASSGDVIGIVNADDIMAGRTVVSEVAAAFEKHGVDAVLCDVEFFRGADPDTVVRRYDSSRFKPERLAWGIMPAHTGLFLKRSVYDLVGPYRTDYRIAADFELIVRAFATHRTSFVHLPLTAVRMQTGGVSTAGLRSKVTINREVLRACRDNGVATTPLKILRKYWWKLRELSW